MRVSSSTVNCPFYCFSPPPQPPPAHCQPCALESKDAQNSSCRSSPCSLVVEEKLCDEKIEISANGADGQKIEVFLKSSLRKKTSSPKEMGKDRIKWMDDLGKELVEIREFDPIEVGESYPTCSCVIV
ncbi:hypothetical protein AXF42_Ash018370 [Apostasia shenzhenica]|uniref:Uncharacterized protein n=1 Tax=Apostasia shenzhenica TaxID=1088818 RepID=A0A2H9ZRA7_9ASPA|nr:hypothetical protein AXF42_Ash018370 [Apostasia shenzhenica]